MNRDTTSYLWKSTSIPNKLEPKEHIQIFLELLNYDEGFIENIVKERQPLQGLLKKNNTKSWEDLDTKVVKRLKQKCKNLSRLEFSTTNDNLILETDASNNHWSAILKTIQEKISRYTSGTFKPAKKNYHSNKKELLTIKNGVDKFTFFLFPKKFKVRYDNIQVKRFLFNKLPNFPKYKRLIRW